MPRLIFISMLIAILNGCATEAQKAAHAARVEEFRQSIPVCQDDRQCERMWAAARQWVLTHAGMKLQHVTNDYMETYNSPQYSGRLAVRVVKEPLRQGGYRFVVTTHCDPNLFLAGKGGCAPGWSTWDAALDFNRAVNAAR